MKTPEKDQTEKLPPRQRTEEFSSHPGEDQGSGFSRFLDGLAVPGCPADPLRSSPVSRGAFRWAIRRTKTKIALFTHVSADAASVSFGECRHPKRMVQLLYVIRGSVSITWRLTTRKTTQGKALIYGLTEPRQVTFKKGTKVLSIVTDEMYFRTHAGHRYTGLRPLVIANDTPIQRAFCNLFLFTDVHLQEIDARDAGDFSDALFSLLHGVISEMIRHHPKPHETETRLRIRAIEAIYKYRTNPDLTVEMLAEKLGVTPQYLDLVFESTTTRVKDRILAVKLEKAAQLLSEPKNADLTIADIASQSGFRNASHFTQRFRRVYGETPNNWRKKQNENFSE